MKQSDKTRANKGRSDNAVGEEYGEDTVVKTHVRQRKVITEGYVRADSLDKVKLKKYVKALAKEAEHYRNARKE